MLRKHAANPRHFLRGIVLWSHRRLYPGARTLVGALITVGGFFGFLPVLGFWMIPVGLVVMGTDIPPVRDYLRARLRPRRGPRVE